MRYGIRPVRHRGMALVAVLWITAALSILVTGMVGAQRDEVRVVSTGRLVAQGAALGSAAAQLVLHDMASRPEPVARLLRRQVSFAGAAIEVEVIPLNGLVDLNRAPPPLLAALFAFGGGLDPARAESLAQTVAAQRQAAARTRGPRFEAAEDLLQVEGVDYALYARLSRLITTDALGSGRVNALAAPPGVLLVLSQGDAGRASLIAGARDSGQAGVDTTGLPQQFLDNSSATRFKLVARVPMADGRHLLSARWAETGRATPEGVPWRIFHAEDQIEPMQP